MPEVMARRRPTGPLAGTRYGVKRWAYRMRPQLAVVIAFAIACLLGVVAASIGIQKLDGGASQAQAQVEQFR
jgi:hypothetical protein